MIGLKNMRTGEVGGWIRGICREEIARRVKLDKKAASARIKKTAKKVAAILLVTGLASFMLCGVGQAEDVPLGLIRPRNLDEDTTRTWTFQSVLIPTSLTVTGTTVYSGGTTFTGDVDINPSITPNTSLRPVDITYDYAGAVDNAGGVDMDLFGYRVTITQTSSNDDPDIGDRGYLQPIRSDIHINGFVDDAYALYGKVYVDGASTANQIYGANLVVDNGANLVEMDETGNLAGLGISINGDGDVTCGGTGYGKYSGIYVNWNQTTDLTVDSCGSYFGVQTGALLDSGYRINASGTLTNAFHSYNSSGTITTGFKADGAHTNCIDLDSATPSNADIVLSGAQVITSGAWSLNSEVFADVPLTLPVGSMAIGAAKVYIKELNNGNEADWQYIVTADD